jgi:surface antigen
MTVAKALCAAVVAVVMTGCENVAQRPEAADTNVARLLGSPIGEEKGDLVPTAAGTLLGPYAGSDVGKSLQPSDRISAEDAAYKSLDTTSSGQTSSWRNPTTGHSGTLTLLNLYRSADDLPCRDYEQSVTSGGQTEKTYGTACRADGGSWRIVETPIRRSLHRDR